MLQFMFLSDKFYKDYAECPEIEQKQKRPYIQIKVIVDGVLFGVPLRSRINHPYVLWTDKANRCGVDFSKAVVIADPYNYIDKTTSPYIRPNEFNALRGKEHIIQEKLKKYIDSYKKAKNALIWQGIKCFSRIRHYNILKNIFDPPPPVPVTPGAVLLFPD